MNNPRRVNNTVRPIRYFIYGIGVEKHPEGFVLLSEEVRKCVESLVVHNPVKEVSFNFRNSDNIAHTIKIIPVDQPTSWADEKEKNKSDPLPIFPVPSGVDGFYIIHSCPEGDYYVHYSKFPTLASTTTELQGW